VSDAIFSQAAPNEEALAMLRGKRAVTRDVFDGLLPELKARAFTVSGVSALNVLERCREAIAGVAQGTRWDDAKDDLVQELDPWLGDGSEARAELLLRQNANMAFQAANYEVTQQDPEVTHYQYLTMEDERVRPSHAALDGVVLPKDDEFWQTHFPPWDWGCRCSVRGMSPEMVDEAKDADKGRNPEDRNVIEGPAAEQLGQGTLMRNGRRFDVSADDSGTGFSWEPGSMALPVEDLKARYAPEEWADFEKWARNTHIDPNETVWQWLTK
jgi:SPP1 gp7 family putative phage head morphogenesis protein